MQAALSAGYAWLGESKVDEALKSFEAVPILPGIGARADRCKQGALIGKARCQAEKGQADEAIRQADEIIAKASPDEIELLAKAYLTKGVALEKAKKSQEAIFALLHVDTLYSDDSPAHAEALYHLVGLWQQANKPQRVLDTTKALQSQYPNSRWTKLVGKP
jgi:tetratricopeptide (TPR) repeat protein